MLPYIAHIPDSSLYPNPALICFLHGYDEGRYDAHDALELVNLNRHGPLSHGAAPAFRHCVIVMPQLPRRGDLWNEFSGSVNQIVKEALVNYNCNPEQVVLTGFSFGANGVFDIFQTCPSLYKILIPVDPTRCPELNLNCAIWMYSGECSRRRERMFVDTLELVKTMEHYDRNTSKKWLTDNGLNHVETAKDAYSNPELVMWIKNVSK
ncbi:hypothetical protein RCL1_005493 [Eukaryota sp. TZLM3-RCL]